MIVFAILGLALGIAIGVYLPVFPQLYSKLVAVAFMASLDAAFGGLRAVKEGTYDSSIFISGFSLALSLRHKNRTAALKKAEYCRSAPLYQGICHRMGLCALVWNVSFCSFDRYGYAFAYPVTDGICFGQWKARDFGWNCSVYPLRINITGAD